MTPLIADERLPGTPGSISYIGHRGGLGDLKPKREDMSSESPKANKEEEKGSNNVQVEDVSHDGD